MCGIAGIVGAKNVVDLNLIIEMTDKIIHRGPDGFGHYFDNGISLGHRRLSIVDLSEAGQQPMEYMGRYVITFNGEVYNYIELRVELENLNYSFHSNTDTEVIMAAYDYWGKSCVDHFNGMWAFAIYDRRKRQLFCSRDRFGIKPFYYWISPNGEIYFGSEIKQFLVHPNWKAYLNSQRAYDYLAWGVTSHTDETLFEGVYSLSQGHNMCLNLDKIEFLGGDRLPQEKWYFVQYSKFSGTFDDAKLRFKDKFLDSVKLRLRSDVPVGSCLSGGLDSSSIVCVASKVLGKGVNLSQKTFSICSHNIDFDEREWIDSVVEYTGVDSHCSYPELDAVFEKCDDIIWHQEVPYAAAGVCMQWEVMSLASKSHMKVLLDGQGADEYLAGYDSFFAPYHAGLFKNFNLMKLYQEMKSNKFIHGHSYISSVFKMVGAIIPKCLRDKITSQSICPVWLDVEKLNAKSTNPYLSIKDHSSDIRDRSLELLLRTNVPLLLHWEDRNSMAHSIESRVPFLDHNLVEFAIGLPDRYKIMLGSKKHILRHSLDGVIPDKVKTRMNKLGFVAAEEVWMRGSGKNILREKLSEALDTCNGIIKKNSLDMFEDILKNKKAYNQDTWRIINFANWVKVFDVNIHR